MIVKSLVLNRNILMTLKQHCSKDYFLFASSISW